MLNPRLAVRNLREYRPPLGRREGLRLDFNENTEGCSPSVLRRLQEITAEDLARYPEREPVEAIVAGRLGLSPDQVLLTNGVDEAIHLVCETYLEPSDEVLVVTPTFGMYEIYAGATAARVQSIAFERDFSFPRAKVLESITSRTRMIAIANPNNPTGSAARRDDLLEIAAEAPDAAVLVDEAYFEFHGKTVVADIGCTPNLFVARTFSKAYGLAGLRIGILAGGAGPLRSVRRVASPYNVNAIALAVLPSALADTEYVMAYASQVKRGRERIAGELRSMGIHSWPSEANFILFKIGERHGDFVSAMRDRGVLVRDRSADPGCEGCIRVTVGTDEQVDCFLATLREVIVELDLEASVPA